MFDGMAQVYDTAADSLSVTRFKDFVFNVGAILDTGRTTARSIRQIPTPELVLHGSAVAEALGVPRATVAYEAQSRFTQALKGALAPLLAVSFLLVGGFSRFGLWRQILAAVAALIVLEALDSSTGDLVRRGALAWPAAFLPAATAALTVVLVLVWAGAPRRNRRASP